MKKPTYLQLYEEVREDIVRGVYPYGTRLPSKRLVAEELEISTITVEHAYALLADEGYVDPRERSGYFVTFRGDDYFEGAREPLGNFQIEQPSPAAEYGFPFSVMARAMRKVIADRAEQLLEKSPNQGCLSLRMAISEYLFRNRGIKATPEQIVIGSGAEYLYSLIVGLLGRERIFALESPSYPKIEQVYRASGVRCELLPLSADGVDSAALADTRASVLHISPYRSFPTGITASASKKHEYIRWADRENRYLVEDDFESEFSISKKSEETLYSLSKQGNVIYLNTFTQTVSPALRVGYMVLPTALLACFCERVGFFSCTVPTFEQYLLCELLRSGDFERHVNRVRRQKRKGR